MEPTRVAQFDDEMYKNLDGYKEHGWILDCIGEPTEEDFEWARKVVNDHEEKQIADSHDITKSNFGFK